METLNFNHLLGKTIKSIGSSFLIVENNGNEFVEFRMDYQSYFVIDAEVKWHFQKIFIHGEWVENIHGQDLLSISLSMGEMFSGHENEYSKMPYPSSIAIWNGFQVKRVDVFGYNEDFNLIEATKHVLQLTSIDKRKILIRPETAALGLIVTMNQMQIENFFSNTHNSAYIYHADTFE